ncbi:MAG: ABC transporter ATP-binding protein [Candidatus Omnitrophica bacterium]|nr:ABC transporter ATP-binding protein [Candidatus Omnitrophota bacterium]
MKNYLKEYFKLLRFAKSYRGTLALAGLCMGISTIFEGVSLGMIIPLADRIFTNKEIIIPGKLPPFLVELIDKLNSIEPLIFLKYIIIFVPVLFLLKGIFTFLQDFLMNIVGQGVVRDVRNRLYSKFQDLSMEFYGRKKTGELMARVTNDVSIITNAISYALKDLIYESMKAVFFAVCAFYIGFKISWQLPLVAFVILPCIMFPVVRIGKRIKKFSLEVQKKIADLNSLMAETIQGAQVVKAFCREDYELERFKKINQHYYKFTLKTAKRMLVLSPFTEFVGVLGVVAILWIVGNEVISGRLSFGVLATFLAFLMSMIRPFKKLSNVYAINQQALTASARIYDILEEDPKVKEKENADEIKYLNQGIIFNDVEFSYNEDEFVLGSINLEAKKGEVVALVGHSGAGKSTLVGLIPRFYDPQKGSICIDGVNIKDFKIKDLRSLIAVVSQDIVLFNSTIRDNIAYGRAEASESEIIEAAKKAHAYEFIMDIPNKFDAVVGDRGFRLSGGEKQRIAIARAILKNSPILILDEATSHLDSVSEKLIKEALYMLMEGKTSFIIAHRLSTVQKADKVVVFDKGKIIEMGTHQTLIESDSAYKKLYDLQFSV